MTNVERMRAELHRQHTDEMAKVVRRSVRHSGAIVLGWILLSSYVVVAMTAYALRHPELTDTQRLLRFWDAVTWK